MFDFLQKGIEYNKLSNCLNNAIQLADQLQNQYDHTFNSKPLVDPLIELAYQYKIEITDRLVKYNWSLGGTIFINGLKSKMTLGQALAITVEKITTIAGWCGIEEEVLEIMSGGDLFYKIKR